MWLDLKTHNSQTLKSRWISELFLVWLFLSSNKFWYIYILIQQVKINVREMTISLEQDLYLSSLWQLYKYMNLLSSSSLYI